MRTNILLFMTVVLATATLTYAADSPRIFNRQVNNASMRKARTYIHMIVNHVLEGDFDGIRKYAEKLDELEMIKPVDPTGYEGEQRARAEQFVKNNEAYHAAVKVLIEASSAYDVERTFKVAEDITRSCVACHAQFAQNKFPAFRAMQGR